MNVAFDGAQARPRVRTRVAGPLRDIARAWHTLSWRHAVAVLAVGSAFGIAETLRWTVALMEVAPPDHENGLGLFGPWLVWASATVAYKTLAAGLLAFGLVWLEATRREGFAQHAALVVIVSALTCLALAPAVAAVKAAFFLAVVGEPPPPWTAAGRFLFQVMHLAVYVSLWTLVYVYLRAARRSAQLLAAAQARGADAARRVLAEQLAGAQAMVEPEFLFETLQLADRLLEHDALLATMRSPNLHGLPYADRAHERDAASAQQLLDELSKYLRAALPPADGSAGTLGRQAELVRARLAIERIRLGGRLRVHVDVPRALANRSLEPLLLLPLVVNAVRHGIEPGADDEVHVQARDTGRALQIDVADCGAGRAGAIREGAGLTGLRERLVALYGHRAKLLLIDREPRGLVARIEIAEGGRP
jgi:signal transduction histidine kinase